MTDPYTSAQLLELANAPTEEEGGPRDGDWMVEAAAALKDAARQIAERPVPTTGPQESTEPEVGLAGTAGTVEFGVVLDDAGSTDVYATEAEARAHATSETPLVRIVTTPLTDAEADSFHTAMRDPEPTVQVPVALIKRVADRADDADAWGIAADLRDLISQSTPFAEPEFRFSATTGEELRPYQTATGDVRARVAAAVMPGWTPEAVDAAYGAYMSDDTPSIAEPPRIEDLAAIDRYHEALGRGLSDYEAREEGWPTAPRIEDMAPGSEVHRAMADMEQRARENATRDYWNSLTPRAQQNYRLAAAAELDPSTIRDVTPPKVDDRG